LIVKTTDVTVKAGAPIGGVKFRASRSVSPNRYVTALK
jgi:hypothetical protein